MFKSSHRMCSVKKRVFLEISQNSQENTCARVCNCNFVKNEYLAQVFSCEFCDFSKNTFSTEQFRATASVMLPCLASIRR